MDTAELLATKSTMITPETIMMLVTSFIFAAFFMVLFTLITAVIVYIQEAKEGLIKDDNEGMSDITMDEPVGSGTAPLLTKESRYYGDGSLELTQKHGFMWYIRQIKRALIENKKLLIATTILFVLFIICLGIMIFAPFGIGIPPSPDGTPIKPSDIVPTDPSGGQFPTPRPDHSDGPPIGGGASDDIKTTATNNLNSALDTNPIKDRIPRSSLTNSVIKNNQIHSISRLEMISRHLKEKLDPKMYEHVIENID
ncbi:hypothetical protein NEOKW01_0925 [Nematocida sp. AWRm80]|nr:hypothetical protein NEOKW01_0925 [Nematocida sp. AWRm80]